MQYINLKTLTIENTTPDDIVMVYVTPIHYNDADAISSQWQSIRAAVQKGLAGIDRPTRPHRFDFEITSTEELSEEAFESAVKLILAAAFEVITSKDGRKRERRLDVPENLKTLNCNMSLLKNAINYQTTVDKFQIEIYGQDLRFILVGDFDA